MWQELKIRFFSLKQSEKEFVFFTSFIIILLTCVPLTIGLISSDNAYFTGGTFIAAPDKMVYLSQIEEIRQGNFFIHNLHTSEPQIGYFSPLWLTVGLFSRLTTLTPLISFHLFRIIFGFIFLFMLYLFIAQVIPSIKWRKITFLTIILSSGLGIFTVIRPWTPENMYNYFGADIWFSEGNTFLTLYHSPLFILSQIFIISIFWWAIARIDKAPFLETSVIAFLAFLLALVHPYDIVIIVAVLLSWYIVRSIKYCQWSWQQLIKLLFVLVASFIGIGYFLILKQLSPGFAGWAAQNITLSPLPYNYMVGYGLIFLFFLLGIFPAIKGKSLYYNFLGVWAIVSWLLLYVPLPFQRRLGNGLHLPMVLIAVLGLNILINRLKRYQFFQTIFKEFYITFFIITILSLFLISTTLFLLGAEFFYHLNGLYYITNEEKAAIIWFKDNLTTTDVILSEVNNGYLIPALSGRYVYLGHGHQTSNWKIKKYDVEQWFFKNNRFDQQKYSWLKREGIDYIYYGPKERALGDFQPQEKVYLKKMYYNNIIEIFKVI